ncbi:MAG: diacylglycerol kinase family lipid kinase [Clostridium sp.]|nr:diacylglycerol kinase family lipid kinase [Clostridium sp.]
MKKSALVIINPTSGKEEAPNYEEKLNETLTKEYSNVVIKHTKGEGDATQFAKEAGQEKYDLVVALGGDGTVNETVNGLAGFDQPPVLGIIPMGTVNDLARSLKIPLEPEKAIELLVKGQHKAVDIGQVNGRYFTNVLGIGKATKAVHDVDIKEKSKLGALAYVKAIASEILEDDFFPIKIDMDDKSWEGDVAVVLVALIDSLGGNKSVLSDVEKGDGYFHIFAIKRLNFSKLVNMAPALLSGAIEKSENVEYFKSKTIHMKALNSVKQESDIDGEKGPDLPLELKILPRRLTVICNEEER